MTVWLGGKEADEAHERQTSGEARALLLKRKQSARAKSHKRVIDDMRKHEWTESEVALQAFDDGYVTGYEAGYQQALDVLAGAFPELVKRQRSGIMSTSS